MIDARKLQLNKKGRLYIYMFFQGRRAFRFRLVQLQLINRTEFSWNNDTITGLSSIESITVDSRKLSDSSESSYSYARK